MPLFAVFGHGLLAVAVVLVLRVLVVVLRQGADRPAGAGLPAPGVRP